MAARAKKVPMSDAHKKALAEGREQAKAVRDYLTALEAHKPKRGRKRTPDSVRRRLVAISESLVTAAGTTRLDLIQERRDLEVELAGMQAQNDLSGLEKAFVKHAKAYGQRKGISHASWREVGVAPEVLKKAGITRGA